jgi:hypothetical protein
MKYSNLTNSSILTEQDVSNLVDNDILEIIPWKTPAIPSHSRKFHFCPFNIQKTLQLIIALWFEKFQFPEISSYLRGNPAFQYLCTTCTTSTTHVTAPHIFSHKSPATKILDDWRCHGYLVLKLDSNVMQTLRTLNKQAELFFALKEEEKKMCTFVNK